jgi:hypothetical protein
VLVLCNRDHHRNGQNRDNRFEAGAVVAQQPHNLSRLGAFGKGGEAT